MTVANARTLNDAALDSMGGDCCDIGAAAMMASAGAAKAAPQDLATIADPAAFVRTDATGGHHLSMFVDNLQCAACIRKIEAGVAALPGVNEARVNMSTRRVAVSWQGDETTGKDIARAVAALGYPVAPFNPEQVQQSKSNEQRRLLSALAVAGFITWTTPSFVTSSAFQPHAEGVPETSAATSASVNASRIAGCRRAPLRPVR